MQLICQAKTNWKFLLIIIVLAVAAGGGIWWCQTKEETTPSPEIKIPAGVKSETADSSSTALATEDWQTYRNEEYGFEIKYPNEWRVAQVSDRNGLYWLTLESSTEDDVDLKNCFDLNINFGDFPTDICFVPACEIEETISISSIKVIKSIRAIYGTTPEGIGCEEGVETLSRTECEKLPFVTSITSFIYTFDYPELAEKEISSYGFRLECYKQKGIEGRIECNKLFEQILSTFRFLE